MSGLCEFLMHGLPYRVLLVYYKLVLRFLSPVFVSWVCVAAAFCFQCIWRWWWDEALCCFLFFMLFFMLFYFLMSYFAFWTILFYDLQHALSIVCCCMFCFACYFMLFTTLNPTKFRNRGICGVEGRTSSYTQFYVLFMNCCKLFCVMFAYC